MDINLNFIIDKNFLAYIILLSEFADKTLANKTKNLILNVCKNSEYHEQRLFLIDEAFLKCAHNLTNLMKLLYSNKMGVLYNIMDSNIFNKIYRETVKNKVRVAHNWNIHKKEIIRELSQILKFNNFNTLPINVYCVHPSLNYACTINGEFIIYGSSRGLNEAHFDNCILVHEFLHTIFKYDDLRYEKNYDMVHAIIELISDGRLYQQLNMAENVLGGHNYLIKYRKHLIPLFNEYLSSPNTNINEFIDSCLKNETLHKKIVLETVKEGLIDLKKTSNSLDNSKAKKLVK